MPDYDISLFGAPGVSDPYVFEPGLVGIKRRVNFNVANASAGTAYAFIPVPKGMVVTAVRFKGEGELGADDSTFQLKVGNTAVSSATTVANVKAGVVEHVATAKVMAANSMVCLVSSAARTAGSLEATVIGYLGDGESVEAVEMALPMWRAGQTDDQYRTNVSGGDAYNANREGLPIYPVHLDQ